MSLPPLGTGGRGEQFVARQRLAPLGIRQQQISHDVAHQRQGPLCLGHGEDPGGSHGQDQTMVIPGTSSGGLMKPTTRWSPSIPVMVARKWDSLASWFIFKTNPSRS